MLVDVLYAAEFICSVNKMWVYYQCVMEIHLSKSVVVILNMEYSNLPMLLQILIVQVMSIQQIISI
jgi:hypothetical protein